MIVDGEPALAVKLPVMFVVIPVAPPPPPPAIVMVFVAPVPDATTPDPTKSNVVATVDNALPSSLTVTPPVTFEILDPSPCKKFE